MHLQFKLIFSKRKLENNLLITYLRNFPNTVTDVKNCDMWIFSLIHTEKDFKSHAVCFFSPASPQPWVSMAGRFSHVTLIRKKVAAMVMKMGVWPQLWNSWVHREQCLSVISRAAAPVNFSSVRVCVFVHVGVRSWEVEKDRRKKSDWR